MHSTKRQSGRSSRSGRQKSPFRVHFLLWIVVLVSMCCSVWNVWHGHRMVRLQWSELSTDSALAPWNFVPRNLTPLPSSDRTMSACLLVMDDTIKLTEWIAYHYTVLPLGHLIVAVDPNSRPEQHDKIVEILQNWQDPRYNLNVTIWTNDTWMEIGPHEWWYKKGVEDLTDDHPTKKLHGHRRRQRTFAYSCAREMMRRGRGWTLFTDSDEFLLLNRRHNESEHWDLFDTIGRERTQEDIVRDRQVHLPLRDQIPDEFTQETLIDFLDRIEEDKICLHIPGIAFSSREPSKPLDPIPGTDLNPYHFMTQRFTYHGKRVGTFSKALIDLSQVEWDDMIMARVKSIHNPNVKICGQNGHSGSGQDYIASLLRFHHYVGTLEAFAERTGDPRNLRTIDEFAKKNREIEAEEQDDDLKPWLNWFVQKVGRESAQHLLQPLSDAYNKTTASFEDGIEKANKHEYADPFETESASRRTMSACLLLKDETLKLSEWIAYHFTALPLGHLIVAIDPNAQPDKQEKIERILDSWKDPQYNLNVTVWTNDTWMEIGPTEWWYKDVSGLPDDNPEKKTQTRLRRQRAFAYSCGREMLRRHRDWTFFTKVDEFVLLNHRHNDTEDWDLFDTVNRDRKVADIVQEREKFVPIRDQISSTQFETVVQFLDRTKMHMHKRCFHIPGLLFSSEELEKPLHQSGDLNPNYFMTQRFTHHGKRVGILSKVLMDMSQVQWSELEMSSVKSMHNPNVKVCGQNGHSGSGQDYISSVLRFNRYIGTYEGFAESRGERRSESVMKQFAKQNNDIGAIGDDDDIRPWLDEFVNKVGADNAKQVTQSLEDAYQGKPLHSSEVMSKFEPPKDEKAKDPAKATTPVLSEGGRGSANRTMSACLLVMDDTIKLTEFIAYHYTVLPLGHLIVAVDPNSRPEQHDKIVKILESWQDPQYNLNVTIWTNDTWMEIGPTEWWYKKGVEDLPDDHPTKKLQGHRRRQRTFAYSCAREMMRRGRDWTLFTDSDEFVLLNRRHNDTENWDLFDTIGRERSKEDIIQDREKYVPLRDTIPAEFGRETVVDFLDRIEMHKQKKCMHVPGISFSSREPLEPLPKNQTSAGLNPYHFMTQRFTHHEKRIGTFSKALIDLSQVEWDDMIMARVKSIHNPNVKICGQNGFSGSGQDYIASVLRFHHYIGTLEAYAERTGDPRNNRTMQEFADKNKAIEGSDEDNDLQPWLELFVKKVGPESARHLLKPLADAYEGGSPS